MKRLALITVAAAALLGGCASYCPCVNPSANPVVLIDGKTMLPAVVPDPLHFAKGQTDVVITWHLPPNSGLSWPANGITIDGELVHRETKGYEAKVASAAAAGQDGMVVLRDQNEIVKCERVNAIEFSCLNRHTRPGVFKYTVRVQPARGPVIEQDPRIMND